MFFLFLFAEDEKMEKKPSSAPKGALALKGNPFRA
jgi:hypothetical protein